MFTALTLVALAVAVPLLIVAVVVPLLVITAPLAGLAAATALVVAFLA